MFNGSMTRTRLTCIACFRKIMRSKEKGNFPDVDDVASSWIDAFRFSQPALFLPHTYTYII